MPVKRTVLGPGKLTIDTAVPQAWESQVINCVLVPKAKTDDPFMVLSGEMVAGDRSESFTLKGKLVPDFGQASSIQEWLFTNRGKTYTFEFIPRNQGSTKKLTGTLVVEAVEIGGDVGKADPIDFEFIVLSVNMAAYTPIP